MSARIHIDLAGIFESIEIRSDTAFSFRGESEIQTADFPVPVEMPGHPSHPVSDHALVRSLQATMYHRCYCEVHCCCCCCVARRLELDSAGSRRQQSGSRLVETGDRSSGKQSWMRRIIRG